MQRKSLEKRMISKIGKGRRYGSGRPSGPSRPAGRPGSGKKRQDTDKRLLDPSRFVKKAIRTVETEPYNPKHRFADFKVNDGLKRNLYARGFSNPTPIQDGAIPPAIDGRDVIGIANTGTGKTVAFLVPLIDKAYRRRGERALIVTPTRELALQIETEFRDFSKGMGLRSAVVIGGTGFPRQIAAVAKRPEFVIGTPGRIKDLVSRGVLDLAPFNNVVLDEADRMLDMGFVKDIREMLDLVNPKRQTLFFSATMPKEIGDLAVKFLSDPVTVEVKSRATSENVEQDIITVKDNDQKLEILHDLLLKEDFRKVLVFRRTKRSAENLAHALVKRGFRADAIHGDKSQGQRERALRKFSQDELQVLVATDVAARGLDIPNVSHVLNYDLPENYEDYIHRIGRTGRGTKTGFAFTFVEEGTMGEARPNVRNFGKGRR
ncbi:MAG: DEAD/DEAH box helicase [Candidatus Moranbacteria bacterium]|nr:DEAD/DEAH box helicase [Candidatus Moranbacteria bacterium]NTW45910.1 DEAD/DEAH box helicase [Candidatus Moranbacteria bacterium]